MSKRKMLEDIRKCLAEIEHMATLAPHGNSPYWDGIAKGRGDSAAAVRKVFLKWDRKYGYHILPSGERPPEERGKA